MSGGLTLKELVKSDQEHLVVKTFVTSVCREIASVATALPQIDWIVFTGGVGENNRILRKKILEGLTIFEIQDVFVHAADEEQAMIDLVKSVV